MAADIQAQGLREPIELLEGKILDGRNRYLACKSKGIKATFRILNGSCRSPVAYVASKNLHRRHLSTAQRAAIGAQIREMLKEEARKRQGTRTDLIERKGDTTFPPIGGNVGESADEAARLVNVGRGTIDRASRVLRDAPDLHEKMLRDEISVEGARAT